MSTDLFEGIESTALARVHGGQQQQPQPAPPPPPPHYNMGDLVNGGAGALFGALAGGPLGAAAGFGAGFMSRNVNELGSSANDLYREWRRGQELDAKRKK